MMCSMQRTIETNYNYGIQSIFQGIRAEELGFFSLPSIYVAFGNI